MKTLKDLTPEIEAKIPDYISKALDGVFDGKRYYDFDLEKAKQAVYWNYEKCGFEKPLVLVAENPLEQHLLFNYLKLMVEKGDKFNPSEINMEDLSQTHSTYLFTLNVYSDCYYSWYSFIKNEFNLPLSIEEEFETCFKLQRESGIYSAIFTESVCVICKYPKKVYRDEQNNLHNPKGQAVEWGAICDETQMECYYIHGRNVPKELFTKPINKKQFLNEENEDIKAAIYEIIESNGEGSMLKFLNAKKVHEQSFVHSNGDIEFMELYKTREKFKEEEDLNGKSNVPLCWLKLTCPSTNSTYLIPSDSSFETCEQAAKYARPDYVSKDIPYNWFSRS
jgi:hypothetical protein